MPTILERLAALFSRDMRAVLRNPDIRKAPGVFRRALPVKKERGVKMKIEYGSDVGFLFKLRLGRSSASAEVEAAVLPG